MEDGRIELGEEVGAKRTFVWAVDWPGWCRTGKDRDLAIAAMLDHADRYRGVVATAGLTMPAVDADGLIVVETGPGSSGTDFGVPSTMTDRDRRPVSAADAERIVAILRAAWAAFDRIAAAAPPTLRKGPRGGGRDTAKVIEHVVAADGAYAREIGATYGDPEPSDATAIAAGRASMLDVLGRPSDGAALGGRRWTTRYAAGRIAWHALDHAWEIEDRTES